MRTNDKPFLQRKTTWAAFLSGASAVAAAASGTIDYGTAAQMVAQAILALTLRSAVAHK